MAFPILGYAAGMASNQGPATTRRTSTEPLTDTLLAWPLADTLLAWPLADTLLAWPLADTLAAWPLTMHQCRYWLY